MIVHVTRMLLWPALSAGRGRLQELAQIERDHITHLPPGFHLRQDPLMVVHSVMEGRKRLRQLKYRNQLGAWRVGGPWLEIGIAQLVAQIRYAGQELLRFSRVREEVHAKE